MKRILWLTGMVGSVAAALAGNGLPDPYAHWVTTIAAVAAALTGYQVSHPPPSWDGVDRRTDPREPVGIGAATVPGPGPSAHSANR